MKKKPIKKSTRRYDSERETRVLLERLGSDIKIVAEGHGSINRRLDTIKMAVLDNSRQIKRLDTIEMVVLDNSRQIKRLDTIEMAVLDNGRQIKHNFDNLDIRINRIENKLDTVTVNHENRIQKLESFHR